MAQRANKDKLKGSLSLSKSKKKGNVKHGTSAGAAVTTAPITSFFSSQPPPKLACPLCGQFISRFKINEHIDLQCLNFERDDNIASSTSNSVVTSIQLSPRRNIPKSPELHQNNNEDKDKEQTSPYFKKNHFLQTPQEITNKSVVRMIDLGSLSAKLSGKCQKIPEGTQTGDQHVQGHTEKEICSETLTSSQKENLLFQTLEETNECVTDDFTTTSADTLTVADYPSDTGPPFEHKASDTVKSSLTPSMHPSSSKIAKRKKETTSYSRMFGVGKKVKYDRRHSSKPEEATSSESVTEKTNKDQPKTGEPPRTNTVYDPPLSSVETYETSAEVMSKESLQDSGAESSISGHAVTDPHPTRLPYYLRNFCIVLKAVLENEDDRALFDQQDMSHLHAFENLSGMLNYHSIIIFF